VPRDVPVCADRCRGDRQHRAPHVPGNRFLPSRSQSLIERPGRGNRWTCHVVPYQFTHLVCAAFSRSRKSRESKQTEAKKENSFHARRCQCRMSPTRKRSFRPNGFNPKQLLLEPAMSNPNLPRLHAVERQREILTILARNGRITVEEVAQRFGVSAVTAK
jgi:DeoR-like helix-turn-helix domain